MNFLFCGVCRLAVRWIFLLTWDFFTTKKDGSTEPTALESDQPYFEIMGQWPEPTQNLKAWSMTWQNLNNECTLNEDSAQPGHLDRLMDLCCVKDPSFLQRDINDWQTELVLRPQVKINKIFQPKSVNIFLQIFFCICFGCSKEASHCDGSFEYPQHMFRLRNKKIIFLLRILKLKSC